MWRVKEREITLSEAWSEHSFCWRWERGGLDELSRFLWCTPCQRLASPLENRSTMRIRFLEKLETETLPWGFNWLLELGAKRGGSNKFSPFRYYFFLWNKNMSININIFRVDKEAVYKNTCLITFIIFGNGLSLPSRSLRKWNLTTSGLI